MGSGSQGNDAPSSITTPFEGKLSTLAKARTPSQLRSLAPALKMEDCIWLAGGLPPMEAFPLASVTVTTKYGETITVDDPNTMYTAQQYNLSATGYPPLHDWITEHTKAMHAPPNDKWKILVTSGNSSAMSMVFEAMLESGDALLVEESNFASSMSTLSPVAAIGVRIVPVPLEPDGAISCPGLQAAIDGVISEGGKPPKMLYTVPTGQNPTGGTMSLRQLQDVYDICCKNDIIVMEDDPYWYLQFPPPGTSTEDGAPGLQGLSRTFLSIDTDSRVVRLDSIAKFIAPGFRGGWITAPDPLHSALTITTTQSTHGFSSFSSVVFHSLLSEWGDHGLQRHLRRLQFDYGRRAAMVVEEAEKELVGLCEWVVPKAGMFMWLRVLGIDDTAALMEDLMAHKVVLVPGSFFTIDGSPSPCFRLCFASATDDAIRKGVQRLAGLLRSRKAAGGDGR